MRVWDWQEILLTLCDVSRDQRYTKHIIGSWTGALLMIIVVYYGTASLQSSFSCNRLNLKS